MVVRRIALRMVVWFEVGMMVLLIADGGIGDGCEGGSGNEVGVNKQ